MTDSLEIIAFAFLSGFSLMLSFAFVRAKDSWSAMFTAAVAVVVLFIALSLCGVI